jgi:SAM-dependent methyltransferase
MADRGPRVRPGNYAVQARTYDLTRGASPTVVRALASHLGPAEGRTLLDIAGGTGNYAQVFQARGFVVLVVDASVDMLAHAARKIGEGRTVAGDAELLPFRSASIDAAVMVNAIHLLHDPKAALQEARRVLSDGPLVLTAFTRENLSSLFLFEYFGLPDEIERRPAVTEVVDLLREAGFSSIRHEPYVYTDTVDGSLNALHISPNHLAGPAYLRNTSFWHRLDEETRRRGLEALARDLRSGVLEARVKTSYSLAAEQGHGTVFAARPQRPPG